MGLSTLDGKKRKNPHGVLPINESKLPNTRGSVAIAHWDCVQQCNKGCKLHPADNGGSEFFINLRENSHLNTTWGGYCVFAEVVDQPSFDVVDAIAQAKKNSQKNILITKVQLQK